MRGQRIHYSADEMEWLEANRSMIISDYHREFVARFQIIQQLADLLLGCWFACHSPMPLLVQRSAHFFRGKMWSCRTGHHSRFLDPDQRN